MTTSGSTSYFTSAFWRGAGERALKAAGQTAAAFISAGQVGILEVDGQQLASVVALAAAWSLFTSIGNADFVAGGSRLTTVQVP